MIDFRGAAHRLEDIDVAKVAHVAGLGQDELRAVLEVESRGHGFDKNGRPLILFEPHVFYRLLSGAARKQAVAAGLAYPKWGEQPYPADSYPRLQRALEIDEAAAIKACSWGLGQILGENFSRAGFHSAREMALAMCESEVNQLAAMIRFIRSAGLADELQRHDWDGFARGYNGPSYKKHNYAGRLAAAYARWQRVKDTPYAPDLRTAAQTEQAAHEAQPPAPPEPGKTGITETATTAGGFSVLGLVYTVWEKLEQAPESILNALIQAAQKPSFWVFVGFGCAITFIAYQRMHQKRSAADA